MVGLHLFDDEVKQYNQFMIAEAIGRKHQEYTIKFPKEDAINSYLLKMFVDSIHKPQ